MQNREFGKAEAAGVSSPSASARVQSEQRLSRLQQAVERTPTDVRLWRAFILELRLSGQKVQAKKAAQKARVTVADRRELKEIADGRKAPIDDIAGLINAGSLQQAWNIGMARLTHFPKDARLLNMLGVTALTEDDTPKAETIFRQALALAPNDQPIRANLGYVLLRQNRALEAVDLLKGAAKHRKASLDIKVNLAIALWTVGQMKEADDLSYALLQKAPNDAEVVGIRSKVLISLNKAAEALSLLETFADNGGDGLADITATALRDVKGRTAAVDFLDKATDLPKQTDLRVTTLLAEWGESDRATTRARKMADADPADSGPVRLIGLLSKWTPTDPLLKIVQKNMRDETVPPLRRGTFGLIYAKALKDFGDHGAAMDALDSANAVLRGLIRYDVTEDEKLMRDIAACWTAPVIKETSTDARDPKPIFIVGLPRSGSTLLETILSCHRDIESLGESPVAYSAAFKARLTPTQDAVAAVCATLAPTLTPKAQKLVMTDKLLANFLNVGVLAAAFPKARFVGTKRDYRATCFSIYSADLSPGAHPYAMNQQELGRYAVACDRLMSHWADVLGERFIFADYENLVSDPNAEIPRLLQALSLPPDAACLTPERSDRSINTMSVGQARKPISTKSVAKWRMSEEKLRLLIDALKDGGLV